jgi:D-glycero-D-manno-heptose 1,7-bisphosphate phosphatase
MPDKAIFVDRDNTLIEDPGYISDPSVVKLLPGVEQAIKSLQAAGYKIVVVTNQSGIARGLLTEEMLEKIHDELRRQLAANEAYLDAIYYCPFHPEGTVEGFAMESELRKPSPGMLLKAAKEMDLDLAGSWMVGDSPRDIEAGQRASCRTIRVRIRAAVPSQIDQEDEDVQADFTVRNLAEAARIILQRDQRPGEPSQPSESGGTDILPVSSPSGWAAGEETAETAHGQVATGDSLRQDALATPSRSDRAPADDVDFMDELDVQRRSLRLLRELAHEDRRPTAFVRFCTGLIFSAAVGAFVVAVYGAATSKPFDAVLLWMLASLCLIAMTATLHLMARGKPER